jgi:hypothetical protein
VETIMLWLKRLFRRRAERQRQIFRYFDGVRRRGIDPIAAYRALASDPDFRYDLHVQGCLEGDLESIQITLAAVRRTFDVRPWNEATERGLTEEETLELLPQFYDYMESLKKNTAPWPSSSPSTASCSPELAAGESATTSSLSGSG